MGIIALQNYFMMYILVYAFGNSGGVIKGVASFCYSIVNIFMAGVQGSMRPLSGLLSGSDDRNALRHLMRHSIRLMIVGTVALTAVIEFFPGIFFRFHGITDIPDGGILSLRLGVLEYVFWGINALFRVYFTNRKDKRFAVTLTWLGNGTLPLFAWIMMTIAASPYIWLSFTLSQSLILIINLVHYRQWVIKDSILDDPSDKRIYMSVDPDAAVDASHVVQKIGMDDGFPAKIVYRVKLCMEEVVAYVASAQKNRKVDIQVDVLFTKNSARFMILDDGARVDLDDDWDINRLSIDNYTLMQKIAATIDYQYILDMNFFVLTFQE